MDRSQRQLVLAGGSSGADGALALALAANGHDSGGSGSGGGGAAAAAAAGGIEGGNDGVLVAAKIEDVTERHFFVLVPGQTFNRWKCLGCMKIISGNLTTRGRAHLLRIPW